MPWRDLRTLLAAFGLAAHLLVACAAGAPVDGGRPAARADSGRPVAPSDSGRPAAPSDSGRPAAPFDSGRPAAPSDSGRPVAPSDSGRPAAPSDSGRPAAPSDSGRPAAPSDSGRLAAPADGGHRPADSGQPATPADGGTVRLRLLALNDFHGALSSRTVRGRPAGGAAVLATYLTRRAAEAEAEGATALLVHAGDMIGGSPLNSALLQDEPTVRALDAMGMAFGAAGNHEFDEGLDELLRLQQGGCHPKTEPATGCFEGARFRWLAANVVRAGSDRLVLPPYVVVEAGGIPVGFIGVVLAGTPAIQTRRGVAGLKFLDEAETVNRYVAELADQGVRAIVVLIHQGGSGSLDGTAPIEGPIVDVVRRFHPQVDLVVSGHTHRGYVGWLRGRLITQAYANGTAFADIDLVLDRRSRDVVASRAEVVTAFHQPDPGNPASAVPPDRAVAAIVARADAIVAKVAGRVVGTAAAPISRARSPAGESALGNLIADAQRAKTGTQVAFTNPGGIRDDIRAGTVTYGDLFAVQPFGNALVTMTLGGDQLARLLEQQWRPGPDGSVFVRVLQLSGLRYTWNARRPPGRKVVDLRLSDGRPIDPAASYTVAVNSFLADGGDGFQVLREATSRRVGAGDLEALVEFITRLPQPFTAAVEGRIHRE